MDVPLLLGVNYCTRGCRGQCVGRELNCCAGTEHYVNPCDVAKHTEL